MNLLHNVWLIICLIIIRKSEIKKVFLLKLVLPQIYIEFGHVLFFHWISQFVTRFFSEAVHLMDATRNKFNCKGDERRQ